MGNFYIEYRGKRVFQINAWLLALILACSLAYCASGCGQYTSGDTDRKIDCIDGCTPEGVGNEKEIVQGPIGPAGRDGTNGRDGRDGKNGRDGVDGQSGRQGEPGKDGEDGSNGSSGSDGYSSVVSLANILLGDALCPAGGTRIQIALDTNRNGTWDLTDSQQQLANICNGTTGQDGADGEDGVDGTDGQDAQPSPLQIVEIVDPCGDKPGVHDEVFLRLQDGKLLASFSENANGKNTRFSLITAGSYVTTDGTNCFFSVDSNGHLYNEHY